MTEHAHTHTTHTQIYEEKMHCFKFLQSNSTNISSEQFFSSYSVKICDNFVFSEKLYIHTLEHSRELSCTQLRNFIRMNEFCFIHGRNKIFIQSVVSMNKNSL